MFEWLARIESAMEDLREVVDSQAEGLTIAEAELIARQVKKAHDVLQHVLLRLDREV